MPNKHTPGPWKFDHDMDGDFLIWADSKPCIAITDHDHEDDKANGQLMAAAPELLDALGDALVVLYSGEGDIADIEAAIKKAEAAIAKAKGESL